MVTFKICGFLNAKQTMPCNTVTTWKWRQQWRLLGRRRRVSFVFRWLKYQKRLVKGVKIGHFSMESGLKTTSAMNSALASDECTSFVVPRAPGWCSPVYRCDCGWLGGTVMLLLRYLWRQGLSPPKKWSPTANILFTQVWVIEFYHNASNICVWWPCCSVQSLALNSGR